MPTEVRLPDDPSYPIRGGAHITDLLPGAVVTFSREELLGMLARSEGAESIMYPARHFQQLILQALAALPPAN